MSKILKRESHRRWLLKYTTGIVAVWTLILAGLLARDIALLHQSTRNLAIREAHINLQKNNAFLFWSTIHAGFYVPIDEHNSPNPYLDNNSERDIETPSGVQLTLMNPMYALRLLNEEFAETYGSTVHLTSLRPLRPENTPDDWERKALKSFENGETEVLKFTDFKDQPHLRLMQPLITQENCIECHKGNEVGDVRGGVSVAVPLDNYLAEEQNSKSAQMLAYVLIWALGSGSIILCSHSINNHKLERERAEEELKNSEKNYHQLSEHLAESNSMKELLLDIITHDLKNPVGVIKGFAQLGLDNDPGNDILEEIEIGVDNLLNVINNATTLSKVTIGDGIAKERLDLTNIIKIIIKEFLPHLQLSKMRIDMKMKDGIIVNANPIISEIFRNYISNAIKYAKVGKKIIIDANTENGNIVVNVKDFGKTIDNKIRKDIFTRKYQLSHSKGRGLGLAIVKRISDAHNAKVGVKPNEPNGNLFYLKLPIVIPLK